jgi:tRNA-dihydrouridine synthase
MQDVTDLPFMRVMAKYGGPDVYFTEYFRVHRDSHPEKWILRSIDENPTDRPIVAQMIGQDIPALVRTAKELQRHPVAGIDLNLGCPAPIVCKKEAGGGLLKNPGKIDEILKALRDAVETKFTVKTRVGFDDAAEFEGLLEVFSRHPIDLLTVHGRTVREMYRPLVHHDRIAQAVAAMPCPVVANGSVYGPESAQATLEKTGAAGLMIGRGAIRNPWVFNQIREAQLGQVTTRPTLRDVRAYLEDLYRETTTEEVPERARVGKMKKYLGYLAPGIGEEDAFWKAAREATRMEELWAICGRYLENDAILPEPPACEQPVMASAR